MSSTNFDTILNQLLVELAEDRGGTVITRGTFTGDDKNGQIAAGDVAAPNTLGANDATGAVIIGGRDTSGNFRFDFADGGNAASNFLAEVADLLGDLRTILADDPKDASDEKDVLEQLLKRVAEAFGGTLVADADFVGDNLGDTDNFAGANSFGLEGGDFSVARIGGRSTNGNFKFDFDDEVTAQSFLDVARTLNSYGTEVF